MDSLQPTLKIALHGFLGRPSDWQIPDVVALDYMNIDGLGPDVPFRNWGNNFCQYVNARFGNHKFILLGYSMGGRLALCALKARPEMWQQAHIISANPGFLPEQERESRQAFEQNWADKFLNQSWDNLINDWNSQAIFSGDPEPLRFEQNYDRKKLASCLQNWSLSKQQDFRPWIAETNTSINWWVGEKDIKYKKFIDDLKITQSQKKITVPGIGHRIIFQNKFNI